MSYASDFVRSVGAGYISTTANGTCAYCPYANGNEYLATLNIKPEQKWRDFGVFLVFVFSNWALVYFFIYTVRVKKWSFGMGYLFGGMGKISSAATKMIRRK